MAQPPNSFQQTVNIFTALGVPGELSFDGPIRSKPYNLYSAGVPNLVGNAYTVTNNANPDPSGNSPDAGTAQVGGTGVFAGILVNPKAYAAFGTTSGGPLGPTLQVPDYTVGELLDMGEVYVYLPGPANVGDLVMYDPLTGNLSSMPPVTNFTGSIAAGGTATADVLTVSAVTSPNGNLAIGTLITGAGVAGGTFIASLGTGLGGTGTYNLSTINEQTVSSEAMVGTPDSAPPGFTGDGYIVGTTLTIGTASTGKLQVGSLVTAVGILPNTVITAYGTGKGGTGNYTVNQSQTLASVGSQIAMATPGYQIIPHAVVGLFGGGTPGGLSSIKLTN